jgi:hypothetical protein
MRTDAKSLSVGAENKGIPKGSVDRSAENGLKSGGSSSKRLSLLVRADGELNGREFEFKEDGANAPAAPASL